MMDDDDDDDVCGLLLGYVPCSSTNPTNNNTKRSLARSLVAPRRLFVVPLTQGQTQQPNKNNKEKKESAWGELRSHTPKKLLSNSSSRERERERVWAREEGEIP